MQPLIENECLYTHGLDHWNPVISSEQAQTFMQALESGQVIYLPNLSFNLEALEQELFSASLNLKSNKNISYNCRNQFLGGIDFHENTKLRLTLLSLMKRYHEFSAQLLNACCPSYKAIDCSGRTSFRPMEIKGRKPPSYRKDDTRLHVDAFPSTPVNDSRILRIFTNINPFNEPRSWRLGENFSHVVKQFLPKVRPMLPLESEFLYRFKITRKKRSYYDHCMLQIHNRMKSDLNYQQRVKASAVDFPPGSTWIVYTDLVSHAALSGRFLLEQTYYPEIGDMQDPELSPQKQISTFLQRELFFQGEA